MNHSNGDRLLCSATDVEKPRFAITVLYLRGRLFETKAQHATNHLHDVEACRLIIQAICFKM